MFPALAYRIAPSKISQQKNSYFGTQKYFVESSVQIPS